MSSEMMSSAEVSSMAAAPAGGTIPATAVAGDVAIAAAGSTADGFGYIGVWAKDAATCAAIGDPSATGFAVITTSTYRTGPSAQFGAFGAMTDGKISLEVGDKTVALEQASPDTLSIDGVAMVRCRP
jgi:hypothetical protein